MNQINSKLTPMNYFNQQSERLTYRALTENDIQGWLEFFEDTQSLEFLGIDPNKAPLSIAQEWITKQLERYANDGTGHLAVIENSTGAFIGMTGILKRNLNDQIEFEIAWSVKPKYRNKGYATEMAQTMKKFGYKHALAPSFISIIHKKNFASIQVAKKNKMTLRNETNYLGMDVFVFETTSENDQ